MAFSAYSTGMAGVSVQHARGSAKPLKFFISSGKPIIIAPPDAGAIPLLQPYLPMEWSDAG